MNNLLRLALSLRLDGVNQTAVVVMMALLSNVSVSGSTAHSNYNSERLAELLELPISKISEALDELSLFGFIRVKRGCVIVGSHNSLTGFKLTNFLREDGVSIASDLQKTLSDYGDNQFAKAIRDIVVAATASGSIAPKEQGNIFRFAHQMVLGKSYRYLSAKEYGQLKNFFKLFATVEKATATIISYWSSNCPYANVAGLLLRKDSLIAKSETTIIKQLKYEDNGQPF
jgi:hypothetical protein